MFLHDFTIPGDHCFCFILQFSSCLSVFVCLSVCPSLYLSVCLSICVHLSVPVCLFVHYFSIFQVILFICLCLSLWCIVMIHKDWVLLRFSAFPWFAFSVDPCFSLFSFYLSVHFLPVFSVPSHQCLCYSFSLSLIFMFPDTIFPQLSYLSCYTHHSFICSSQLHSLTKSFHLCKLDWIFHSSDCVIWSIFDCM